LIVKGEPKMTKAVTIAPTRKVVRGPSRERVIPSARIDMLLKIGTRDQSAGDWRYSSTDRARGQAFIGCP
jgi:hypothetical protein